MITFAELKDVLKGWKLALLVLCMMLTVIFDMIRHVFLAKVTEKR